MRTKKYYLAVIVLLVAAAAAIGMRAFGSKPSSETSREITPVLGAIRTYISVTGTVLPKNRLEVKPPVNGRVESILVKEGEQVKAGQVLAWMSSTERAALLDAARGKGEEALKYWQEAYKPIPLLAPIDGQVIVATTQPGQTVTAADAVVVLSDKLIVRAQVDETDIGKVILGQKATVSLDAFPDKKIKAVVDHIYYESQTVNNVTIYNVDLECGEIPAFFRSGMNAGVDFLVQDKEKILTIPVEAVHKGKDGSSYVSVREEGEKEPVRKTVILGISDDKNIEVVSGLGLGDRVLINTRKFVLPKDTTGTNPFMPARRR